jgi:hypothetical protein
MNNQDDVYIDSYNLKNIVFKKNKKNFAVYESQKGVNRTITIKLLGMKVPFGVEKYGFKELINFEFLNKDTNNYSLNNYNKIKQLDNYFKQLDKFNDKNYRSCIRERDNYDPLLRVHLKKKSKNILTTVIAKDGSSYSIFGIKNRLCNIDIEIQNVWTTDSTFGILFCVKNIKLLS